MATPLENLEQADHHLSEALALLQIERSAIAAKRTTLDEAQRIAVCVVHRSVATDCETLGRLIEELHRQDALADQ